MEADTTNWMILLKTFGSLVLVLGLIFALSWFAKKYLRPEKWAAIGGSGIKVIQSFSIEPKKKLMVVEVENQRLLLGIAENSITCLTQLPDREVKRAVG